jgi:hypothetical protein
MRRGKFFRLPAYRTKSLIYLDALERSTKPARHTHLLEAEIALASINIIYKGFIKEAFFVQSRRIDFRYAFFSSN